MKKTTRRKKHPNMKRSRKICSKAAKARWEQYRHEKTLLLSAYPAGLPERPENK